MDELSYEEPHHDVTVLLEEVSGGNKDAWDKLFSIVHGEIHAQAKRAMRRASPGNTLQTTALVNEVYLRLVKDKGARWKNRTHFFKIAARAMRQILVDRYRRKNAEKRGKGQPAVSLNEINGLEPGYNNMKYLFEDIDALDEALDKLKAQREGNRKCTIIELHFFMGLSLNETAEALDVSMATVSRDWNFSRAWLLKEMEKER